MRLVDNKKAYIGNKFSTAPATGLSSPFRETFQEIFFKKFSKTNNKSYQEYNFFILSLPYNITNKA